MLYGARGKVKQVDSKLATVLLCRERNWTYQQYRGNPGWFTDILKLVERMDAEKQAADDEAAAKEAEKMKRKTRK